MAATHTQTSPHAFIAALANYFKQLPSHNGPAYKPAGVATRGRLPNQSPTQVAHPAVSKPSTEHFSRALAYHVTAHSNVSNGIQFKPGHPHIVHPGKALTLRAVKATHLSVPHIHKVGL